MGDPWLHNGKSVQYKNCIFSGDREPNDTKLLPAVQRESDGSWIQAVSAQKSSQSIKPDTSTKPKAKPTPAKKASKGKNEDLQQGKIDISDDEAVPSAEVQGEEETIETTADDTFDAAGTFLRYKESEMVAQMGGDKIAHLTVCAEGLDNILSQTQHFLNKFNGELAIMNMRDVIRDAGVDIEQEEVKKLQEVLQTIITQKRNTMKGHLRTMQFERDRAMEEIQGSFATTYQRISRHKTTITTPGSLKEWKDTIVPLWHRLVDADDMFEDNVKLPLILDSIVKGNIYNEDVAETEELPAVRSPAKTATKAKTTTKAIKVERDTIPPAAAPPTPWQPPRPTYPPSGYPAPTHAGYPPQQYPPAGYQGHAAMGYGGNPQNYPQYPFPGYQPNSPTNPWFDPFNRLNSIPHALVLQPSSTKFVWEN